MAEREEKQRKNLEIVVIILTVVGALFLLGAVGNADFYGGFSAGDYIRISVGFVLRLPLVGAGIKQYGKKEDTETEIKEDHHNV